MLMNRILTILAVTLLFFVAISEPVTRGNKSVTDKINTSCLSESLTGKFDLSSSIAYFEGKEVRIPEIAFTETSKMVLGTQNTNKWIEVDLSDQKLKAWEGDSLFLETPVSTGLPATPTPTGEFNIWIKLRSTKMEGGSGRYYYNLPNVPYVMYFSNSAVPGWKGYGLHGAYWHNEFGTRRSHGCVNLPIPVAEQLYYWTTPNLPEGKTTIKATDSNTGTRIVIHE